MTLKEGLLSLREPSFILQTPGTGVFIPTDRIHAVVTLDNSMNTGYKVYRPEDWQNVVACTEWAISADPGQFLEEPAGTINSIDYLLKDLTTWDNQPALTQAVDKQSSKILRQKLKALREKLNTIHSANDF